MLKWSKANAKTEALRNVDELAVYLDGKRRIYSLDLLSGWSCPFAEQCLSKVHVVDGKRKVVDGKKTEFRCFSASQEGLYPAVYNSRKHNFDVLRNSDDMFETIANSMPKNLGICRIHVAGDMFSQAYFDAWMKVAFAHPKRLFYAYTKSLKFWLSRRQQLRKVKNFVLTASRGGRDDKLIKRHRLREAVVVYSEQQAIDLGLDIDHDDSHAARPSIRRQSFALLIHGTQPKGTEAAKALTELKGKGSYSKKRKAKVVA